MLKEAICQDGCCISDDANISLRASHFGVTDKFRKSLLQHTIRYIAVAFLLWQRKFLSYREECNHILLNAPRVQLDFGESELDLPVFHVDLL